MISQLLVDRFSFRLVHCTPNVKTFQRSLMNFCPKLNRAAAILNIFQDGDIFQDGGQIVNLRKNIFRQSLKAFMLAI